MTRLLTPADAERYAEIRKRMFLDTPTAFSSSPEDPRALDPELFAERLSLPENVVAVVEQGERFVAAAGAVRESQAKMRHRAFIWGVWTDPDCRGRGFGRAVVTRVLNEARSWPGVATVAISVNAAGTAALALYRDLGFVEWGREPDALRVGGESFDEIHMTLRV